MEHLWAPWRMEYIKDTKSEECIFCTLPDAREDAKNYILHRSARCFVILNIFPYNTGHLMVSPYRHLSCITLLDPAELDDMNRLTQKSVAILRHIKNPQGFNIGLNLGKCAGAGYEEHIHTHVVPRWGGDTNFMPVVGDTKVLPEHLRRVFDDLLPHFQEIQL